MFEYQTKQFAVDNGTNWISDWLNSLYRGGYGVKVVGYVAVGQSIIVTALRWKLSDRPKLEQQTHARTTIDEIPEEPSIQYGESEIEKTLP